MQGTLLKAFGFSLLLGGLTLLGGSGCSKENDINTDNSVGKCSVPAGTCPEGFSPEVTGEASIEECELDGEGQCKKVGTCTVRCVDPRGCTAVGSKCGDDSQPACCGETAGSHSCIDFGTGSVCSKRCTTSDDCPGSCCDASINQGTYAACAPYDVCVRSTGLPAECRACLETECPDDLAACADDEVCALCMSAAMYPSSPECRNNTTLKKGYGCALQKCPEVCDM